MASLSGMYENTSFVMLALVSLVFVFSISILLIMLEQLSFNITFRLNGARAMYSKLYSPPGKAIVHNLSYVAYPNILKLHDEKYKIAKQLGHGVNWLLWAISFPIVNIEDPNDANLIVVKQFDKFKKPPNMEKSMSWVIGKSILLLEKDEWRFQRKLLNPAFHYDYLATMHNIIHQRTNILKSSCQKAAASGSELNVSLDMKKLLLDIFSLIGFGYCLQVQTDPSANFIDVMNNILAASRERAARLFPSWWPGYWSPTYKAFKEKAKLVNIIKSVLNKRLAQGDEGEQRSVLYCLIKSLKDGLISKQGIIDQMMSMIFAGTDSTSTTCACTIYALSQNPDVDQKLFEELAAAFGKDQDPDMEKLQKLPYLNAVVNETLRLYPGAPAIARTATEKITLPSGLIAYPGAMILVNVWNIHRNSHVWGSDAEEFKPERWLDDTALLGKRGVAFLPFSAGKRNCLGLTLAKIQLLIIIAQLVRSYKFTLSPTAAKPDLLVFTTLAWQPNLLMNITPRPH